MEREDWLKERRKSKGELTWSQVFLHTFKFRKVSHGEKECTSVIVYANTHPGFRLQVGPIHESVIISLHPNDSSFTLTCIHGLQ